MLVNTNKKIFTNKKEKLFMNLAFPKFVQAWWMNGKLYIYVDCEFYSPGRSIFFTHEKGELPTFNMFEGSDGSPSSGNIYPYSNTFDFNGPYAKSIYIIDGRGKHVLPVQLK
jgi:hypothetical protein